jgi:hypothetical protein
VQQFATAYEFADPVIGAMAWVGTAVGGDPVRLRQVVAEINGAQHQVMFDVLCSDDIGAQNALLMLRACMLPRASYALRTTAPNLVADFAGEFDRSVVHTLAAIVQRRVVPGTDPFAVAGDSYRLPLSSGGVGLRSAAAVSAAAFVGSLAVSVGYMSAAQRDVLVARGVVHDGLARALELLSAAGATGVLVRPQPPQSQLKTMTAAQREALKPRACRSVGAFVQHYSAVSAVGLHLQRQLTAQFEARNRAVLCADAKVRARLNSAGNKAAHSYRWLTTPPSEQQFRLKDIEVVRALRHRIGLAPADGIVACKCGVQVTDRNFDHFQGCASVRSEALDARHTVVQRAVASVSAMAGVPAHMDYASHSAKTSSGSRLRPDGRFQNLHSTGADVVTDVSITNPSSSSLIRFAAERLGAAAIREHTKRRKYTAYVEREQSTFCPFVFESFGSFGVSARAILALLARRADERVLPGAELFSAWSFRVWAVRVLAAAIQKGNSVLVDVALELSRSAARRRV